MSDSTARTTKVAPEILAELKAVYWQRKESLLCVRCGGQTEEEKSLCCDCSDIVDRGQRRYRARNKLRIREESKARYRQAYADPKRRALILSRQKKAKAARIAAGQCVRCQDPAAAGYRECEWHLAKNRAASKNSWRRLHGSKRLRRKMDRTAYAKRDRPDRPAPTKPTQSKRRAPMRERLLKAMRFLDWSSSADIFEVAGISTDCESREYDSALHALTRLVPRFAERRGIERRFDYRLIPAGIAAADAIRNRRAA